MASSLVTLSHQPRPRLVGEVLDAVLDALAARLEDHERAGRIVSVEVAHLARHRRVRRDDDHRSSRLRPTDTLYCASSSWKTSASVARRRCQLVAPELPGSHRLVDARVEEVTTVARPGEAVVDVVEFVVDGCLAGEGAHGDVVALVAVEVGADRDPSIRPGSRRARRPRRSRCRRLRRSRRGSPARPRASSTDRSSGGVRSSPTAGTRALMG